MGEIKRSYLFRIDDITPWMNRDNFDRVEKIFDSYWIKPIIGVVPDNRDPKLDIFPHIDKFWKKIISLHEKGRIIAQHWYQHKYITKNSGIIWLNNYSEFAWLSYNDQKIKIQQGKLILEKNIWITIKWWMAPAHSFDKNTCKVLKDIGFEYITDWIAMYPFSKYGLKWLPQQIWKPQKKCFWIRTVCLHINNYDDRFMDNIEKFCQKNHELIIKDLSKLNYKNSIMKHIWNYLFKILFWSKIYLYKIKIKLLW